MTQKKESKTAGKSQSSKSAKAGPPGKAEARAGGKIPVIIRGKTHLCELDPNTNAIDLNTCVPVEDLFAKMALSASELPMSLVVEHAAQDGKNGPTAVSETAAPVPPAVKQACYAVAQRTAQFRKQNQFFIAQLSALDLERTANSFPRDVAMAMFAAEQARISLIKGFADFDLNCAALEIAAKRIAQS
ncbi:MAG: hypothetical protein EOR16_23490 [Mesorhizobium sp.]|uniref:hypothetical protein n=1 Tax=Mesorhizobium sp. TaxID=1871066 RepID=UPI000FE9D981|nr:hypothetical protein [Mesorhizobium sp.]RWI54750.1 MAG: hypothetical protein EOR16_23490 [Mesorhizobium sp.]